MALALALLPLAPGRADDYQARPIRLIVPYAASGATDVIARLYAQELGKRLGVNVFVNNRGGGGTNIGAEAAYHAPADGYTLFVTNIVPNSLNPSSYTKLGNDAGKFVHIAILGVNTLYLVVGKSSPARSVKGLAELAKRPPDGLSYGTAGVGSAGHLVSELFAREAGITLVYIPYKRASEATVDLVGRRLDFIFHGSAVEQIRSGELRALAVAYDTRWEGDENIPTMGQEGYPDVTIATYFGLAVPPGTSSAVFSRINAAVNNVIQDTPGYSQRILEAGTMPVIYTPEQERGVG